MTTQKIIEVLSKLIAYNEGDPDAAEEVEALSKARDIVRANPLVCTCRHDSGAYSGCAVHGPDTYKCDCGHNKWRHQLGNLGTYLHCVDCGCPKFNSTKGK